MGVEIDEQVRSDGQHRLYRKLIRRMAQHGISHGSGKTIKELMEDAHEAFKEIHGAGKSTTEMSVSEMHLFYTECVCIGAGWYVRPHRAGHVRSRYGVQRHNSR